MPLESNRKLKYNRFKIKLKKLIELKTFKSFIVTLFAMETLNKLIMECLFRSLRPSTVASVIKIGTVSRAIWPILPGVLYYQYMRQVSFCIFLIYCLG